METELLSIDAQMKEEIKNIKEKYAKMKVEVKKKYKDIEKERKKKEKEEKEENKKMRKSIPKSLKILVWDKNIGKEKGIGNCHVCKSEIDSKAFECGHIISVKEGGATNIENLLPICSSCNKSMGIENLLVFKEKYFSTKANTSKKETVKKEVSKPKSPIEEFIENKLKYNETLVEEEIINQNNNFSNCSEYMSRPSHNDMFSMVNNPVVKIKTGRNVTRNVKLETIYDKYRIWLSTNHPQLHKDTQFEGCFGGNDTMDKIKENITKKFGESKHMADLCNPLEIGKNIIGWENIEILE